MITKGIVMKDMCCIRCAHWQQIKNDERGECRINPPKLLATGYSNPVTKFPKTTPDIWCSKFIPIKNKLLANKL